MRTPLLAVLSLSMLSVVMPVAAQELGCATGPENDERVRAIHERVRAQREVRARLEPAAVAPPPVVKQGAVYIQADEEIVPGYRPFDLLGRSLVFEPRAGGKFAVQRTSLQYVEPAGAPVHDFQTGAKTFERAIAFSFPIFGRAVTRVYVTAFNAIQFDPPAGEPSAPQIDAIEGGLHRAAVLSPLLITKAKPGRLAYPALYLDETPDALIVTWRSTAGSAFGYDVQAQLRRDGTVVYAYRSMRAMSWGAPVFSAGFDPKTAARQPLQSASDAAGDLAATVGADVRPMVDLLAADVTRIDGTDLYAVRIKLAGPVNPSKFASGESLRYLVSVGEESTFVEISATVQRVLPAAASDWITDGAAMRVDGDTIEVYGLQWFPGRARTVRVFSYVLPSTRWVDNVSMDVTFGEPSRRVTSDLSALPDGTELAPPIVEPFTLAPFDPYSTWEKVQNELEVSDFDVDGVLMYQTFFTDLIFYAGAYATGGNAQVNGIRPASSGTGLSFAKRPTLMHMNQLAYGWSAAEQTASNVMLHEFGHRWLYFFSIREDGQAKRSLNPASAHPAGFVHTPAAFPVTIDPEQASVMGGAVFTQQTDGKYKARAINVGYSWTDLYLMGLAAPEEVPSWFYLADTNPALPDAYWPPDQAVVTGVRRDVQLKQVVDVHGARNPSSAMSQKQFRVLFVLVTEAGKEPTPEEIAKLNTWRAVAERNFEKATGGRGKLVTSFVRPAKKRAVR